MGFVKCGVLFVMVVALMASFSVSYTDPNDGKPFSFLGSCFFALMSFDGFFFLFIFGCFAS